MQNLTIRELQKQYVAWSQYNFPNKKPHEPLLGIFEELGELAEQAPMNLHLIQALIYIGHLAHAHLKREQGIRGTADEHHAKAKDAVGDILIFLIDYCDKQGYDLQEIAETTWAEVSKRDWKKDAKTGGSVSILIQGEAESIIRCPRCKTIVSVKGICSFCMRDQIIENKKEQDGTKK